jgi:hypothetical protein
MTTSKRFKCRFCGAVLLGWLSVAKQHLSAMRPDHVGPYLRRMEAGEDIATVAAEAFEVVEREDDGV